MKSFRLYRPMCPACGYQRTRLDWRAMVNAFYLLISMLLPQAGTLRRVCPRCGHRFESRD